MGGGGWGGGGGGGGDEGKSPIDFRYRIGFQSNPSHPLNVLI